MNFNFSRFLSIFIARNKEFYRDAGAMGWTFVFPLLVVLAFGHMFKLGDSGLYKIGYVGQLPEIEIKMVQWVKVENNELALEKLSRHQFDMVVNSNSPRSYWVSETSPKSKLIETLFLHSFNKENIKTPFDKKAIQGREIPYVEWLFPGLLSMNVMWMALWGVGWVIVRQRKLGILKRYKASPLTSFEYLLAQMFSRLVILILTGVIVFAGSHLIYPFQTLGSFIDLFVIYVLGCLSLSSIGLIVASRFKSDEFVSGLLNMLSFPMMFLSEIWFSLEGSPQWVWWLAKGMPLWHMTEGMRRIMNEGAGLVDMLPSLSFLGISAILLTFLGSKLFVWTPE